MSTQQTALMNSKLLRCGTKSCCVLRLMSIQQKRKKQVVCYVWVYGALCVCVCVGPGLYEVDELHKQSEHVLAKDKKTWWKDSSDLDKQHILKLDETTGRCKPSSGWRDWWFNSRESKGLGAAMIEATARKYQQCTTVCLTMQFTACSGLLQFILF